MRTSVHRMVYAPALVAGCGDDEPEQTSTGTSSESVGDDTAETSSGTETSASTTLATTDDGAPESTSAADSSTGTDLPTDVLEAYEAAWAEPDEALRLALLEIAVMDDVEFVDPNGIIVGPAELSTAIGDFLAMVPGGSVPVADMVLEHDGHIAAAWEVLDGRGTVLVPGVDHITLGGEGRIARVHGFWYELPPVGTVDPVPQAWLDAWNEPDAAARVALLEAATTADVVVVHPSEGIVEGHAALSALVDAAHGETPGFTLSLRSGFSENALAWYVAWESTAGGTGVLFATLADDGRIAEAALFEGDP